MIAVSDIHLGYTSQKNEFRNFIDSLRERKKGVDHLVIVGDFLDMWRRDVAGVVIQNTDILTKLEELQDQNITIDIIAGNHDYRIRTLKEEYGYQFSFHGSGVDIAKYGEKYSFYHGYEFDDVQIEAFFEVLCLTTDMQGEQLSDFWEEVQKVLGFWERLQSLLGNRRWRRLYEGMLMTPEERLEKKYDEVRRKALEEKEKGRKDFLVFGHTHEPFVDKTETIANTGSWVAQENPQVDYNTFLEICEDRITLKKWVEGTEVTIPTRFSNDQLRSITMNLQLYLP